MLRSTNPNHGLYSLANYEIILLIGGKCNKRCLGFCFVQGSAKAGLDTEDERGFQAWCREEICMPRCCS